MFNVYRITIKSYFDNIISTKKKMSIFKIKMNSHNLLYSETWCWTISKTSWVERICHLCNVKRVKDEKHFLLKYHPYTLIKITM
jgi:hypothetical protein